MPTYEYECHNKDCVGEFEELHSSRDDAKLKYCPICAKEGRGEQNPVDRLISGGSGKGIMNLTNKEFAATLGTERAKAHATARKSEAFAENFIGSKYRGTMDKLNKEY